MNSFLNIAVIGGDKRQAHLAEMFDNEGHNVKSFGVGGAEDNSDELSSALACADLVILPVPLTKDGFKLNSECDISLQTLIQNLPASAIVFAGKMPPGFKDELEIAKIKYLDYYEEKPFIWQNADITAEGTVSILMNELDIALREAKIFISGFGRIAKLLSAKLDALGADVTVSARRSEELMLAENCFGIGTDKLDYTRNGIFDLSRKYDAVINTVPGWIFDSSNRSLLKDSVYIELASSPFGGDPEFMKKNCKKYIFASSIPGKYAPISASRAVFKIINGSIEEGIL